jgi:hypothetical protein
VSEALYTASITDLFYAMANVIYYVISTSINTWGFLFSYYVGIAMRNAGS